MSLSLLLPAGLFALLALALPLLLHLRRRRQTPPPRLFAALAYVDPQALPRARVRIEDWPLLLLRLLLLAAIALLLAQPLLHGRAGPHWVLLWPGLDPASAGAAPEGAELRWLAPGFPEVDPQTETQPGRGEAAPLSLLRQLAFERPREQKLSVRVPARIEGLDGALPALGRAIEWQIVEAGPAPGQNEPAPPLHVAVLGAPPAAFVALKNYFAEDAPPRLSFTDAQPERGAEVLLQFGDEPLPAVWQRWLQDGGRVLRLAVSDAADPKVGNLHATEPDAALDAVDSELAETQDIDADAAAHADANQVAPEFLSLWQGQHARLHSQRVGRGELRTLGCALTPECLPELHEGGFPDVFVAWLRPMPAVPDAGTARALSPIEGGPEPQPVGEPLRMPLLVLILLLVAAERWLAASRPRA